MLPVLVGLALFLTLFVMQPVLEQSWQAGLAPVYLGTLYRSHPLLAATRSVPGTQAPLGEEITGITG